MLPPSAIQRLACTRFGDVRWFAVLDSTNTYLLGEARAGAAEGLVAVADEQTAGRGRLGRSWVAPPGGSLLMSVLLRPRALAVERAHALTMAVALAAAGGCARLAGVRPELKWPNDLVMGDRKLGGILAEVELGPGPVLDAVVIGIGLNVAWGGGAPAEVAGAAVALDELSGRVVDRAELLVDVLADLDGRLDALDSVPADFRAACATLGRLVRVELPGESVEGIAVDLSPEGHLLLQPARGPVQVVSAGDVVHVRRTAGDGRG